MNSAAISVSFRGGIVLVLAKAHAKHISLSVLVASKLIVVIARLIKGTKSISIFSLSLLCETLHLDSQCSNVQQFVELMTRLPYNDHNHQCTHSHCIHSVAPNQVTGVRFVLSPDENSLSVEWSRPQSDVPILYYEVRYRSHIVRHSWQGPVNATTETVTLRIRLGPFASYGVQVRAVSAIGAGPYSSEETIKRSFQHVQYTYTHTRTHTHTYKKHTDTQHMYIQAYTHNEILQFHFVSYHMVWSCLVLEYFLHILHMF